VSDYLLDTGIISDLIRNPQGRVAERIIALGEDAIFTNVIVASELRYGAGKRGSQPLTDQLEAILSRMTIRPLEAGCEHHYARLRIRLEQQGNPMDSNDLLIAAHSLALDATLVTGDRQGFDRIPDLKTQNWLR
jgi:tRNA(fMet)-specific endonuclease VapC